MTRASSQGQAQTRWLIEPSRVGELLLLSRGNGLSGLYLRRGPHAPAVDERWMHDHRPFEETRRQLEQYFAGRRTSFEIPLALEGTAFQLSVWGALRRIAYGRTVTYAELAHTIGRPKAARACGRANGSNPVSIVVPCHRVVGNTSLVGYGGGLEAKAQLLELEGALLPTGR